MLNLPNSEKIYKILLFVSIFGLICCFMLLFPHSRIFVIIVAEMALGRNLNNELWMRVLLRFTTLTTVSISIIIFQILARDLITNNLERCKKFFIFAAFGIVVMSIVIIVTMQIRGRSLWLDEAMLATSIISRDLNGLLDPPLDNGQSAPFLYIIAVKLLCAVLGYSEFSLRLFSFLAFIGLLICTKELAKKALLYTNYQTAFVVAMSAVLPTFIWYSNEFKPYMSDAFFVVLTFLLYFHYTQGKIRLSVLTTLYLIFFGFSTPVIFFIGGIFIYEFILSIRNKEKIVFVFLSGVIFLVISVLYFRWWHLPILRSMQSFWDDFAEQSLLFRLIGLFSGTGNSDSSFLIFLVPFALLGIYFFIKSKNKLAYVALLSLCLVFSASAMGFWPMHGRLWLFLPAIVLLFTPSGIDFIHNKVKQRKITNFMEFLFFTAILAGFSINSLGYLGDRMYFPKQEINPLIYHVQNNIKEGEKLYIYPAARFTFEFKNGYSSRRIGDVQYDNILFGINRYEWNEDSLGNELQSILEHERVFLIFQHHWVGISRGLDILRNYGSLTEIMNVQNTPLYFFERCRVYSK